MRCTQTGAAGVLTGITEGARHVRVRFDGACWDCWALARHVEGDV